MMLDNLKILYEDNQIIVVIKPENVLSQEDYTKDLDMVNIVKEYIKVSKNKPGNVYLGLVHRLDRRVSGVMVFAKTSKAAKRLSEDIRNHDFSKHYLAITSNGHLDKGKLVNNLSKVNNLNKSLAVLDDDGKESVLYYENIKDIELGGNICSVLDIELITGRYNQIRAQFSLINHPLINDFKYGYKGKNYFDSLALTCYKIEFNHPVSKIKMSFEYIPDFGIWKYIKEPKLDNEK